MVTQILADRHAHADWIPDEYRPLSQSGMAEAESLPEMVEGIRIAAVYSSPYTRAKQTVEPLARVLGIEITACSDLRERTLGAIGTVPWSDAARKSWDDPQFTFPGGESNRDAQVRGVAVVKRLVQRHLDECVVIASHGTLLALIFQAYSEEYDYAFWTRLSMPDAYLLTFDGPESLVKVERLWKTRLS